MKLNIGDKVIKGLFILNIVSAIYAFFIASRIIFPDAKAYWLMAEGLGQGRFSSWYFLDTYYPETLRTPGYPLFLLLFKSIYNSQIFIKLIQLALYFFSLLLAFKVLKKLCPENRSAPVIFLLLTALNIQIPYFSGYISSEILCIFFTILYIYLLIIKDKKLINGIYLGLIAGALYLVKPTFLLFPILLTFYKLLFDRTSIKYFLVHLFIFALSLLPFGFWNYTNHGVFKVTTLEGGAGVAHIGLWSFKLPVGYTEPFYWHNYIVSDMTNPIRFSEEEKEKYKTEFENEWKVLLKSQDSLLTANDSLNLNIMRGYKNLRIFPLYNSKYTIAREKNLWRKVIDHIKEEPVFYLKTRIYSFFRFYFSGLNADAMAKATTLSGKLKVLYSFLITFISILIGFLVSSIYLIKNRKKAEGGMWYLFIISLYQGMIHIPFTIQSRYVIPVHFCILILFSIVLSQVLKSKTIKSG